MTALLELKQKIKGFYSEHDVLLLSVGKFLLAFSCFKELTAVWEPWKKSTIFLWY